MPAADRGRDTPPPVAVQSRRLGGHQASDARQLVAVDVRSTDPVSSDSNALLPTAHSDTRQRLHWPGQNTVDRQSTP